MRDRLPGSTIKASPIASRPLRPEPRTAEQIEEWLTGRNLVMVAETGETEVVAFAASFPYSARPCYAGIGEFSVYVRRNYRGRGAGRTVLAALIEAAKAAGLLKLTSRLFPENAASRALLKGLSSSTTKMLTLLRCSLSPDRCAASGS